MDDLLDRFNSYPLAQKVLVFLIVVVVLFALFWFVLYNPIRQQYQQAENQFSDLNSKIQKKREELKEKVTREELQKLRAEIQKAEKKLPSSTQYRDLLQSIHNKAKAAGLEILNFQPKSHRPKDYYVEIPVDMKLRGAFGELSSFLRFVRGMDRIVAVEDLNMKLKGKAGRELVVEAKAKTYRYKEKSGSQKGKSSDGNSEK